MKVAYGLLGMSLLVQPMQCGESEESAPGESIARTAQFVVSPSAATCATLENWGIVNVTCRGAIPNDGLDDTVALRNAFTAYTDGRPIYFPAGTYNVSRTAADPMELLNVSGLRLVGENHVNLTKIAVSGGLNMTSVLVASNTQVQIENLAVDAGLKADAAIHLYRATSQTYLQNVVASGARKAGFWLHETQVARFLQVNGSSNGDASNPADGFMICGSNAATFLHTNASLNWGNGIVVLGMGHDGSYNPLNCNVTSPPLSSVVQMIGGTLELNKGRGVLVNGTQSGVTSIEKFYIDGNGAAGLGGGVEVVNGHWVHVADNRITVPDGLTSYAVRLKSSGATAGTQSYGCVVENNAVRKTTANLGEAVIKVDAASSSNRIIGNRYLSDAVDVPAVVDFTGSNSVQFLAFAQSATSPQLGTGTWRVGDIVWNTAPTGSPATAGWICTATGTPGTWKAITAN